MYCKCIASLCACGPLKLYKTVNLSIEQNFLLNQVNMKRRGKEIRNKGHTECVLRKTSFHFRSWEYDLLELVFV